MPLVKNQKWTIGEQESVPGVPNARTSVIPIRGTPSLFKKAARQLDPAIVGNNMDVGEYLMAEDVSGSILITPRACPGTGKLITSLLKTQSAPAQIAANLRIRYTGASASCKLMADTGANTLAAKVGVAGAEADDVTFGYGTPMNLSAKMIQLSFQAGGYVAAVPSDKGKPVVGGLSGNTGILMFYDNAARTWTIWTAEAFANPADTITITGGTGAGTLNLAGSSPPLKLTLSATGYVSAVPADIGKPVVGATTGDTGVLVGYDNTERVWIVSTADTFADNDEPVSITGGTGAGSLAGVGAALTVFTLAELVCMIDGYADFACEKVFGSSVTDASLIVTKTTQGKNKWGYLWFTSGASGAYERHWEPDLTDAERPTYPLQGDGYQDNFLFAGCVVESLNLSAALKAMAEGEVSILGFSETAGQAASIVVLEDVDPLIFYKGSTTIAGVEYIYIRNLSLAVKNNHDPECYGQGSVGRIYQRKGKFEVSGEITVRLDANSYTNRAKVFDGSLVSMSFYFKGKDITPGIPEMLLVELPFVTLSNFEFSENGQYFDAKMQWKALYPKGTLWDVPLIMTMVSADLAAF